MSNRKSANIESGFRVCTNKTVALGSKNDLNMMPYAKQFAVTSCILWETTVRCFRVWLSSHVNEK